MLFSVQMFAFFSGIEINIDDIKRNQSFVEDLSSDSTISPTCPEVAIDLSSFGSELSTEHR